MQLFRTSPIIDYTHHYDTMVRLLRQSPHGDDKWMNYLYLNANSHEAANVYQWLYPHENYIDWENSNQFFTLVVRSGLTWRGCRWYLGVVYNDRCYRLRYFDSQEEALLWRLQNH